jgi:hypothetical protein
MSLCVAGRPPSPQCASHGEAGHPLSASLFAFYAVERPLQHDSTNRSRWGWLYPRRDEFTVKRRCLREYVAFPAESDITTSHGDADAPVYAKMILAA